MNTQPDTESVQRAPSSAGSNLGILSCAMALLGIFFWGVVFAPLAILLLIPGFLLAIINASPSGLGYNFLALLLTIAAIVTSPVLLGLIGLSSLAGTFW